MKNNIKTIIQMVKELKYVLNKEHKIYTIVVIIAVIVSSFFELLGVTAILPFIQAVLEPEILFKNQYIQPIIDRFGIVEPKELMILCGIGIIILYLIKNLYMLFSYFIQYDFATKVQRKLSIKMLKSYMDSPYTDFINMNSSEILRGCNTDTTNVYEILSYLFTISAELISIILIGTVIIWTDSWTAIGTLLLLFIVMLGMVTVFKPIAKKAGISFRIAEFMRNKAITQTVGGAKEIYVMQRKDIFVKAYEKASDIARKARRTNSLLENCPDRIIEGICVSGLVGIVCIRLYGNSNMTEFVPRLAMFAMAAFKILPSIGKITSRINGLIYCRASLLHVYEVIKNADVHNEIKVAYTDNQELDYETECLEFKNQILVQQVTWKYQGQEKPVLDGIDICVKKGESVALIGSSGAGKTTLADIVLGLLKPQKGSVRMDGIDIFSVPKAWARIVGYVPQTIFLLDDTIKNNIVFGLLEEEVSEERIWEALERAQLKGFIENLPEGLETVVGERGIKFSGGQRQRLAIARALYNKPEVLILDEATAALDNETELAVMEAIESLQGTITMIIVAHRLTTIRKCDKIFEIKDGIAVPKEKEEIFRGV